MMSRIAIPAIGFAVVSSWVAGMAYVYSAGPTLHASTGMLGHTLFVPQAMASFNPLQLSGKTALVAARQAEDHGGALALVERKLRHDCQSACGLPGYEVAGSGKSDREAGMKARVKPAGNTINIRFDTVVASAALSPQRLAALFARANADESEASVEAPTTERFDSAAVVPMRAPAEARFAAAPADDASSGYVLALAIPEQDLANPFDGLATDESNGDIATSLAALPPAENVPLPARRPAMERVAPAERTAPVARAAVEERAAAVARPAQTQRRAAAEALAYAAPDDGAGSVGKAFKNLFSSGPDVPAGKGVAVYNISAGTVTMPDGQVLEAHSGIGNMADNPKFVGAKMRGPTPPDTYRLKMRETRFHGVEAIRMLPVDGKVKHGRTGLLAHSELLRNRRGQSHGCVAFKDYNRFLAAFKKGKVTTMVVIAGNGRGRAPTTTVAANVPAPQATATR